MKQNEQIRSRDEERGFRIHRLVYLCIIPLLAIINITVVPEFLWFIFPMIGWGIGLTMHYLFAARESKQSVETEYEERIL